MRCPPEIAATVSKLVETALLRVRAAAWSGDADRCAIEADHVHNLPGLIADYSPDALAYYWNVERPSYLAQSEGEDLAAWEPQWRDLRPHVEAAVSSTSQNQFD